MQKKNPESFPRLAEAQAKIKREKSKGSKKTITLVASICAVVIFVLLAIKLFVSDEAPKQKPKTKKETPISSTQDREKKPLKEKAIKGKIYGGAWVTKGSGNSEILRGLKIYLCSSEIPAKKNSMTDVLVVNCQTKIDLIEEISSNLKTKEEIETYLNDYDQKTNEYIEMAKKKVKLTFTKTTLESDIDRLKNSKIYKRDNQADIDKKIEEKRAELANVENEIINLTANESNVKIEATRLAKIIDKQTALHKTMKKLYPIIPGFKNQTERINQQRNEDKPVSFRDFHQLQKTLTEIDAITSGDSLYNLMCKESMHINIIAGSIISEVSTNIDGKYEISNVKKGNYCLYSVYESPFSVIEWAIPIKISSEEPIELNLYNSTASRIVNKFDQE